MKTLQFTIRKPYQEIGSAFPNEIQLSVSLAASSLSQGKDDEIERFIGEETAKAIPLIQDKELMRFRLKPDSARARALRPYFLDADGTLLNTYAAAGFSYEQVRTMSQGLTRSIYVFELFDTPDPDTQRLLSRSFIKGNDFNTYTPVTGGTTGAVVANTPLIEFATAAAKVSEFSSIGLPMFFAGSVASGTAYMRISFFNAATGKRVQFRQRNSTLSLVDKRYIPLEFSRATREYMFPLGGILEIEEVPAAQTLADAETERQKRLNSLDASFTLGTFEPLGSRVFTGTTGNGNDIIVDDNPNTGGGGTGTSGTTGTGIVTSQVPNTVLTIQGFATAELAASVPDTTPATGVHTKSGILGIGDEVYFNTGGKQQLVDGYYGYVVNAILPVKVLRISGGKITELDIKTTVATNNAKEVANTTVSLNVWATEQEGCVAAFAGDIANLYTETGALLINNIAYTSADRSSRLTDGYYSYKVGDYYLVLAIYQGKVADTNVPCNYNPGDTGGGYYEPVLHS